MLILHLLQRFIVAHTSDDRKALSNCSWLYTSQWIKRHRSSFVNALVPWANEPCNEQNTIGLHVSLPVELDAHKSLRTYNETQRIQLNSLFVAGAGRSYPRWAGGIVFAIWLTVVQNDRPQLEEIYHVDLFAMHGYCWIVFSWSTNNKELVEEMGNYDCGGRGFADLAQQGILDNLFAR